MQQNPLRGTLIETIFMVAVAAMVLLIGEVLSLAETTDRIFAVCIIALIALGNSLIVATLVKSPLYKELSQVVSLLGEETKLLGRLLIPSDLTWLHSYTEMSNKEKDTSGQEVWIISPDLSNDTGDGIGVKSTQDVIRHNISRGVKYIYIVPSTDEVFGALVELKEVFKGHISQLETIMLDQEDFRVYADTHVIIFNPRGEGGNRTEVYLELPIEKNAMWIQISNKYALRILSRIQRIVDAN